MNKLTFINTVKSFSVVHTLSYKDTNLYQFTITNILLFATNRI